MATDKAKDKALARSTGRAAIAVSTATLIASRTTRAIRAIVTGTSATCPRITGHQDGIATSSTPRRTGAISRTSTIHTGNTRARSRRTGIGAATTIETNRTG